MHWKVFIHIGEELNFEAKSNDCPCAANWLFKPKPGLVPIPSVEKVEWESESGNQTSLN